MSTLTTKDWIARAQAGQDVQGCLAQAERAVRWPDDWLGIAQAWLDQGDVELARLCIELCVDMADGEHWPCRRAAELLVRLGERTAAGVVLGRVEAQLGGAGRRLPVRAYQWVLLALAYREVLGDDDSVTRCLASAAATVQEAEDLAALADGYVLLLGDTQGARRLLARAEQQSLERGRHRELWTIAISWCNSLSDQTRARAVLARATEEARDVQTLASLAVGWRSLFQDEAWVRSALVRAEATATNVAEWLQVAEAYRDGGDSGRQESWDRAAVCRCLEAALAANPEPTAQQRTQIAVGFRRWLNEPARAESVAPEDAAPESKLVRLRSCPGWETSSPRALLDRVRAQAGPQVLSALAGADYGNDYAKHHQALVEIQASGSFPVPLDWYPREVLELFRWRQGAAVDHVGRAFACAVLALDAALPGSLQIGELSDVLAPLLESAWHLGLEVELEQHLAWLIEVLEPEGGYVWPLFGLLLTRAKDAPDDPRLDGLIAMLKMAEAAAESARPEAGWLLRTSFGSGHEKLWRGLAEDVLGPSRGVPSQLARIGTLLQSGRC
ncbi:MAG TPA: hypothetical protein PLW65_32340 [Pseudomonadota bacterium]|nr:hypothetical protein [Pseudomonadota bacterium]